MFSNVKTNARTAGGMLVFGIRSARVSPVHATRRDSSVEEDWEVHEPLLVIS